MGAVPARTLVRRTWSPPDVLGVSGSTGQRPGRSRYLPRSALRVTGKKALRAVLLKRRDAFRGVFAPDLSALAKMLRPDLTVASYVPIGNEVDPAPLLAAARAARCRIALPFVVSRAEPIRFLLWDGVLEPGPFGLDQPPGNSPEVAPDVVLTPLVGFDRRGNRLGWGAGHYDRAFAAHPNAYRLGLAWSVQAVDALTADLWDVPLHAIVTEKEWIVP